MIIVVNGGYRTGSTFIFLAVQKILECSEIKFEALILSAEGIPALEFSSKTPNFVVKSHNWLPPKNTNIKTIYSRRHFLDVYASFIKANITVLDPITEILEEKRREKIMRDSPCLTLEYADFYDNEQFALNKISEYIGMPLCPIAETLTRESIKKLNHPALMNNHISDNPAPGNFIDALTYEQIKTLTWRYTEVHNG